ncbi:hypothetical protein ACJIZ3_008980 [Penstemon smallii]|uniref:Retrotransposon gag domain-containing protein n=1 Tax=Penstemon smallii TaxID=265156 RepID=A0ABD3TBB8_9LAMI
MGRPGRPRKQTTSVPEVPPTTFSPTVQTNETPTQDEDVPNHEQDHVTPETTNGQPPFSRNGGSELPQMFTFMQQYMEFCQQQSQANISTNLPVQTTTDQTLERFLRFQPPKFFGEPDDQKAELWLSEMENIFCVLNYTDAQKINLATFRLEDSARHWWRVVEERWRVEDTPRMWDNFVIEFNTKFIPQVVRNRREREFMDLTQSMLTVSQYEARFTRLIQYAPHYQNDEDRKVRKFIEGLKLELRWALLSTDITTYSKAVEKALQVESEMKELMKFEHLKRNRPSSSKWENVGRFDQGKKYPKTGHSNFRKPNNNRARPTNHQTKPTQIGPCNFCGHPSHNEASCWKKNGRCIACGSEQHQIKDCPRARNPSSAPQGKQGGPSNSRTERPKIPACVYALEGNKEAIDPSAVVEVCSNAIWINKCTGYFHGYDASNIQTLLGQLCSNIHR